MKTDDLLSSYLDAKAQLDHFKKLESELRIELLERCFGPDNPAGTVNTTVGNYAVKGTFKMNIRLSEEEFYDIQDDLTDAEAMCVRMKPTLVLGDYNKLDNTSKLDECLTVSPGMPSVSIKEIKDDDQ